MQVKAGSMAGLMALTRRLTLALAALVLVGAAGLAPVGPNGPSPVAAEVAVTVTPAVDLVDGQEIEVSGTGGTTTVVAAVCRVGLTGAEAEMCASAQATGYAEPDGSGAFTLTMRAPALVYDGTATVDCRVAACELVLLDWNAELGAPVVRARHAVTFDPAGPLVPAPTVVVTPDSGLADGQVVQITGSGFEPDDWVDASLCAVDGAERGCRWFDVGDIVGSSGEIDLSVRVRATVRSETLGGPRVDCRSATAVCELEVHSAGWRDPAPITVHFDPGAPLLPAPVLTVDPVTDLVDGQVVQVTGTGFEPDTYLSVRQCGEPVPGEGSRCRWMGASDLVTESTGALAGQVQIRAVFTPMFGTGAGPVDCRSEVCSLVFLAMDEQWLVPLAFDPDAPLLPPPTVSVEPTTGIVDGQTVAVTLTGFDPESWTSVEVCQVGTEQCDPMASVSPQIELTEPTVVELQVFGTFATYEDSVDCRVAPGCEVRVEDDLNGFRQAVPISFGPPPPSRGRFIDPVFSDVEVRHDVVYRTTTDHLGRPVELKMDIYQPVGDSLAARPVVMWMHGGWFIFGDKSSMEPYARASAQRGYVSISLQYRLRPELSTTDLAEVILAAHDARHDAVAAVDWIQANAADLRVDPRAIFVGGYSAGGVLSWNLAYPDEAIGARPSEVAAAAPIAGIPFVGPDRGDPPVIGFHAVDDGTVPYGTGRDRCAEAVALRLVCQWVEYPDGGHGIVSSRFRDIVERSHLFFYEQVLAGLGYRPGVGPVRPPAPVVPPTTTATTNPGGSTTTTIPGGSTTTTTTTGPSTTGPTTSLPAGPSPSTPVDPAPPVRPGSARPAAAVSGRPGYTG